MSSATICLYGNYILVKLKFNKCKKKKQTITILNDSYLIY